MTQLILLLAACGVIPLVLGTGIIIFFLGGKFIELALYLFRCHRAVIRFIVCGEDARKTIIRLDAANQRLREEADELTKQFKALMNPEKKS